MIYTIGHTKNYLQYFKEHLLLNFPFQKKGREADYPGGSVWRTKEEAQQHCPPNYSVFGVLADWDTQTEPSKEGSWHNLLVDADLVILKD